ncbi:MAG TPA: monovalent cation/H(+) antiporter subunit G [Pseudonocardiaceae bacterium]|jgi:multicomponent Na+:H+ antiporter subunit G|nr:monovalent cation/H(+) antiporter subunit G [Pseudonocardiaceae bacterium]
MTEDVVATVLVGAGVLVVVLASVGVARSDTVFRRLHYLTVLTSVAAPLIGAGAIVADGFGLAGASILAIVVLLAVTGPVLGAATGRLNARHDGIVEGEAPE